MNGKTEGRSSSVNLDIRNPFFIKTLVHPSAFKVSRHMSLKPRRQAGCMLAQLFLSLKLVISRLYSYLGSSEFFFND